MLLLNQPQITGQSSFSYQTLRSKVQQNVADPLMLGDSGA
jgi:hypothetical protein